MSQVWRLFEEGMLGALSDLVSPSHQVTQK